MVLKMTRRTFDLYQGLYSKYYNITFVKLNHATAYKNTLNTYVKICFQDHLHICFVILFEHLIVLLKIKNHFMKFSLLFYMSSSKK